MGYGFKFGRSAAIVAMALFLFCSCAATMDGSGAQPVGFEGSVAATDTVDFATAQPVSLEESTVATDAVDFSPASTAECINLLEECAEAGKECQEDLRQCEAQLAAAEGKFGELGFLTKMKWFRELPRAAQIVIRGTIYAGFAALVYLVSAD